MNTSIRGCFVTKIAKPSSVTAPFTFSHHSGTVHFPSSGGGVRAVVVIIPPLGRDRIWTYRALFEWADMLARHGYAVLRYDPRDEGDSLLLQPGEEALDLWLHGVEQASATARQMFEGSPLVLNGLRIGATFAWHQIGPVRPSAVVLWDPLPSGQHWVKELHLASVMVRGARSLPDGIEVNGLHLPPQTLSKLRALAPPPVTEDRPHVLFASPTAGKLLTQRLGPQAEQIAFPGYSDLFRDTHVNKSPSQLFDHTRGWLDRRFPARNIPFLPRALPSAVLSGEKWREERVEFGPGLSGILCLPDGPPPKRSLILCNTSANPRAGDGSFATRASRELAQNNVATLRFDFSGYGESGPPSLAAFHVYETSRTRELAAAAQLLRTRGISTVAVAGVCTGGYHAFRALLESDQIDHAIPINAWLHWKPGMPLDRAEHVQAARAVYLKVPAQVRRHLRFRHKLKSKIVPKLVLLKKTLFPDRDALAMRAEVQKRLKRGGKLDIIMWDGDGAMVGLQNFGRKGRWLASQVGASLSFVKDIDHAVVGRYSQTIIIAELLRVLDAGQFIS